MWGNLIASLPCFSKPIKERWWLRGSGIIGTEKHSLIVVFLSLKLDKARERKRALQHVNSNDRY